jgi:PA14 domain
VKNVVPWEKVTALTMALLALAIAALAVWPGSTGGTRVATTAVAATGANGLLATYYDNVDFTGRSVSRVDPLIDFDWDDRSPAPGIDPTTYSVRWTGFLTAPRTGTYRISTRSSDGVRVHVANELLVNSWTVHAPMENSGSITLTGGSPYPIEVEFFQQSRDALLSLMWSGPGVPQAVIASRYLTSGEVVPSPAPSPTFSPSPAPSPTFPPSPAPSPTFSPSPAPSPTGPPPSPTPTPSPTFTATPSPGARVAG